MDERILRDLIKSGYPIIAWTVNDINIAKNLFSIGVHGIQTDEASAFIKNLPDENSSILFDAGGSSFNPQKIIHVKNTNDIVTNVLFAKKHNIKISIGGRRHSMGGQTQFNQSIHLNMLGLNHVEYRPKTKTVLVGSGATWKKIQQILNEHGRSVKVMQSDNIFTVGGSVSVNAHGWPVGQQPVGSTVLSMKVVTSDGTIRTITKESNPKLFGAIVGGYGLFGVIVELELETLPNTMLTFHTSYMPIKDFSSNFKNLVTNNPKIELAYGRLSLDKNDLFYEAGLFMYEKVADNPSPNHQMDREQLIALKRGVFRSSQYTNLGKKVRWSSEKIYAQRMSNGPLISRNTIMSPDINVLWPFNRENKDILHEYFIPKENLASFLLAFKDVMSKHEINLLNVTIREVLKDTVSALPYAQEDIFAIVCFFLSTQGNRGRKYNETIYTRSH